MLKLVGLIVTLGSIIGGFFLGEGVAQTLWQPAFILIVVGGTVGAFFTANPQTVIAVTKKYLGKAVWGKSRTREDYERLLVLLHDLFEVVRKEGRAKLENHIESPEDSEIFKASGFLDAPRLVTFICDNLRITNLGQISTSEFERLLKSELFAFEAEQMKGVEALKGAADAAPGFGIVASVLGVIIAMSNIAGSIAVLGMAVAGSMVGTAVGMVSCYGFITPAVNLVTLAIEEEIMMFDCIKGALIANCSGKHPVVAADAGRRVLSSEVQPSFVQLEHTLQRS